MKVKDNIAGWSSLEARLAHNQEVAGSNPAPASIALDSIILRGEVGSVAHGTGLEGQEDTDHMAVFVEPKVKVCGLTPLDHYIYRDKPEGVRSEAGDLDLTIYSLRKYCRLAAGGNPSVLMLLWLPSYIVNHPIGEKLISIRQSFFSKRCGQAFLGYLTQQKMRLTGERTRNVSRPELVAKYGYDTKFAMHALRLGLQGIEVMTTRHLSEPVPEPHRSLLKSVRAGEVKYDEAVSLIMDSESKLKKLVDAFEGEPDIETINNFLVWAHQEYWNNNVATDE